MKRIVVIGAGFAGLWGAIGAARKLDELSVTADEVEVAVVNGAPFHSIRVRNYESDLAATLVPLTDVSRPDRRASDRRNGVDNRRGESVRFGATGRPR